jgi:phospholipid/cholesterol/gamma-HCH transport system ATP-binding protein
MNTPNESQKGVRVEVRGLCKSYEGQAVLKDVSFDVKPGEMFVIMGPSGSGKTVLLKHLIGLETADSGQVLVDGQSIDSPEIMERLRMAMVFQSGALFSSLTVGENVGLYLTEHHIKPPAEIAMIVSQKLEAVGLKGAENKMPSDLSGGMKKRAAIARALVIEPQLMLYDEPTSELDPVSSVRIAEEITRLNQRTGVTSLIVSHDRDMAFGVADRIAVMMDGHILAIGTPKEIKTLPDPRVRAFLDAAFGYHSLAVSDAMGRI